MRKYLFRILSFILSILLIWYLLSYIDLKDFGATLVNIDVYYYLLAMLTYLLAYVIRALRIWELFDKQNLFRYILFVSIHQVLNRVMPFRSGEILFPVLIKKMAGRGYSEGIPKLLILRLLDLISLIVSFLLVCIFVDFGFNQFQYVIVYIVFFLLLILFFTLKYSFPFALELLGKLLPARHKEKAINFSLKTKNIFDISYIKFIILASYSILDKFINFVMCFFALKCLGFHFEIAKIISANTMSGITEILPVNSLGSFGTTELGWAGALMYFGESAGPAIASGFGFNIIAFSFTILFGLIGFIIVALYYKVNLFKKNSSIQNTK
jgi:uncharacterized membrane protein YbhN (UPF0104 family)